MIEGQIRPTNGITKDIISAFASVVRSDFVPTEFLIRAYTEKNIQISQNRFILKPSLTAQIINYIDPRENESILVLPASTGYLSAILSKLSETVVAIEEDENLISFAEQAMYKSSINNVVFLKKRINENSLDHGPFNVIIIEGAIDFVPEQFLKQLEDKGRLFALINDGEVSNAKLYTKYNNSINSKYLFSAKVPKLNFFMKKNRFSF